MGEAKRKGSVEQRQNIAAFKNTHFFFFDETNNFRKLYLSEKKNYFNSVDNPFVLGGIVVKDSHENIIPKLAELQTAIKMQPTQNEIKFGHLAKGDFNAILKSKQLLDFFKWLDKSNFFIHYSISECLFWSLIDIIESDCALKIYLEKNPRSARKDFYPMQSLKQALYDAVKNQEALFFEKMIELKYPNISERKNDFLEVMNQIVAQHRETLKENTEDYELSKTLSLVFKTFKETDDHDGLFFLEGEPDHEIINNLIHIYLIQPDKYESSPAIKNSFFLFDEEKTIQSKLGNLFKTQDKSGDTNYSLTKIREDSCFIESKDNIFIQISDVIVGFLGKFFNFVLSKEWSELEVWFSGLNDNQKEILRLYFLIEKKSAAECHQFLFRSSPRSLDEKVSWIQSKLQ